MNNKVDLTWKNLVIAALIAMLPLMITGIGVIAAFKGYSNAKFIEYDKRFDRVPTNDIILQWMSATKDKFENNEEILHNHIQGDKEKWDRQYKDDIEYKERLTKIEDAYLKSNTRGKTKKPLSYLDLNNFLWENGKSEFMCQYLEFRID